MADDELIRITAYSIVVTPALRESMRVWRDAGDVVFHSSALDDRDRCPVCNCDRYPNCLTPPSKSELDNRIGAEEARNMGFRLGPDYLAVCFAVHPEASAMIFTKSQWDNRVHHYRLMQTGLEAGLRSANEEFARTRRRCPRCRDDTPPYAHVPTFETECAAIRARVRKGSF